MGILVQAFRASAVVGGISLPQMIGVSNDTIWNDSALITTNPIDGSPLLDELFDEEQFDLADSNASAYRNPGDRPVRFFAPVNGLEVSSIGIRDEREPASYDVHEYDAVLQMILPNGGHCTATISTVDGFTTRGPAGGTIISTAAHCLVERNPETEAFIRYVTPEEIRFVGSYMDEQGQVQQFELSADEAWINPLYQENRLIMSAATYQGASRVSPYADTALFYSSANAPEHIRPAHILPVGYSVSVRSIMGAVGGSAYVTAAGHSGDIPYLTAHVNAVVPAERPGVLVSQADILMGASGGPVFASTGVRDAPFLHDSEGRPYLVAVNTTIYLGREYATHASFDPAILRTVPFLRPNEGGAEGDCQQYGEVLATNMNIRHQPDVDLGLPLVPDDGREVSTLPRSTLFNVLAMVNNDGGQQWALVRTEYGDVGYISANPDYVNISPRHCP